MKWITTDKDEGLNALEAFQRWIPEAPVSYLRQLFSKGKILREGSPLVETDILRCGEALSLPRSQRLLSLMELSERRKVDILLETEHLIAVFKPSGLAVHRGVGHDDDNLLLRVRHLMKLRQAPFSVAPVHRLDAETSGAVIFAKGRKAAGNLGRAFIEGSPKKIYLALVSGELPVEGVLDTPVPAKGKLKEATTAYRVIATCKGYSLVRLRLFSGRTHQIRRQLADAGHPIAGDRRYGGKNPAGLNRLFLHETLLELPPIFDDAPIIVSAPLPSELVNTLYALEFPILDEKGAETGKTRGFL